MTAIGKLMIVSWLILSLARSASFTGSVNSRLEQAVAITIPPTRYEKHLKIARTGFTLELESPQVGVSKLTDLPDDKVMLGYLRDSGVLLVDLISGINSNAVIRGSDYVALYEFVNYSLQRHHSVFHQQDESLRPWIRFHAFLKDLKSSVKREKRDISQQEIASVMAVTTNVEQEAINFLAISISQDDETGGIFITGQSTTDQAGEEGNVFYLDPLTEDVKWLAEHERPSNQLSYSQGTLWYGMDLHLTQQGKRTLAAMIIAIGVDMVLQTRNCDCLKPLLARSKEYWDLLGAMIRVRYEGCTEVESLAYLEPLLI